MLVLKMTNKNFDKSGRLLEAVGTIDELMAVLDLVGIKNIHDDLMAIMSELAVGKKAEGMDERIKNLGGKPKKGFFINFKTEKAKKINWARTVARRAERRVVSLSKEQEVDDKILLYLNRLSDYLFTLGRREERR